MVRERKKENLVSLVLPDTVLGNIHRFIYLIHVYKSGFPDSSVGKESACNAGDPHLIPGSGISSGERIGYPLQYSSLENSMDCIVHGVTKSWTRLSKFHSLTNSFNPPNHMR